MTGNPSNVCIHTKTMINSLHVSLRECVRKWVDNFLKERKKVFVMITSFHTMTVVRIAGINNRLIFLLLNDSLFDWCV